jgi:hypothetical protein
MDIEEEVKDVETSELVNEMEVTVAKVEIEEVTEEEEVEISNKLHTRKEYISQISELSDKFGKNEPKGLKYMKKDKLKEEMSKLINDGVNSSFEMGKDQAIDSQQQEANDIRTDFAVDSMVRLNYAAMMIAEKLTKNYKKQLGGNYIDDWVGSFERDELKKEELRRCLKAIFLEYREEIEQYVSPISVWAMLLISSGIQCIKTDIKEKILEDSIDDKSAEEVDI